MPRGSGSVFFFPLFTPFLPPLLFHFYQVMEDVLRSFSEVKVLMDGLLNEPTRLKPRGETTTKTLAMTAAR